MKLTSLKASMAKSLTMHGNNAISSGDGKPRSPHGKTDTTLAAEERAFRATDEDSLAEQKLLPNPSNLTPDDSDNAARRSCPYHFVPLRMNGRTNLPHANSAALIDEIGGLPALEEMTNSFYTKAFCDVTLDKFIRSHDDPHASRFARWIHQKLTASSVWDDDRMSRSDNPVKVANGHKVVVHDRSSAHVAAWHSTKRPPNEVGRHFQLDECRVWMRLHFWAMRECVGDTSPAFIDYYVRFIGHFVSVYERTAPKFARDSYRWSANQRNIQDYLDRGCQMDDVIGVTFEEALGEIPEEEANDYEWPYVSV